jgi:hypothetical protein
MVEGLNPGVAYKHKFCFEFELHPTLNFKMDGGLLL